ncbi:ABC transporter permease [Tautonia plasticadhaerens]|uniref:Spermidine/putrescine ABC transporter membrane protein n=1 Tax=Tautonia plasticadhaerens TaxID=2527974 RepID=A0A518HAS4_9BACT|nr:iron ABC transporter permease [Tautonia plasticadhaerens]QDV37955.1 spermidine/putrescine ABC transporter membrane protein [Tautonia plasticadhaerens]
MNRDRWAGRAGRGLTGLGLVLVLYWPILATALQAARGDRAVASGFALIDASAFSREASIVSGPAFETIRLAGLAASGALAVGLPMAVLLWRTDLPGRGVLLGLMAMAAFVPMPLYAAGWLGGFGNAGYRQVFGEDPMLVGWAGATFVHAASGVPWVVLLSGVGLRGVAPELEESALLDLPAWRVLIGVTLRGALGAVLGAAMLVLVLTSGDMTITDFLLVRSYAEEAYVQYGLGRPPAAVALVAAPPTLAIGLVLLLGSRVVLRVDPARVASPGDRRAPWGLGRWRWPASAAAWIWAALLLGLPVYAMAWRAGRVGGDAASGAPPGWSIGGLGETLAYAAVEVRGPLATTAAVAAAGATLAAGLAWALAWQARAPGAWRWFVLASAALMLALPGPVSGMALKLAYLHVPPVSDSAAIVALGYALRALPFALLVTWPAVRGVPDAFLESAELDGLGPIGRAWRVGLPMTRGAFLAAWLVAFVLAMGELPITNLVTPAGLDALPVVLWGQMHFGVDSRITGVGLVLLGVYAAAGGLAVGAARMAYAAPTRRRPRAIPPPAGPESLGPPPRSG